MLMDFAEKRGSGLFPSRTRAIVLGSYPPRPCGIAAFTSDVVDSMSERIDVAWQSSRSMSRAANGVATKLLLSPARDATTLRRTHIAETINADPARLLPVQHEYGLIITMHAVL